MTTINAGWAMVGKPAGSYEDYSTLAASATPFTARNVMLINGENSPGNPPPPNTPGGGALPWVWFAPVEKRGVVYLTTAIRDWSNHADATDRPIAYTRYFFVSLDDFLGAGLTFATWFGAVRHIEPPWRTDRDPFAGATLDITIAPPSTGGRRAEIDSTSAATAAAALLTGAVTLLGGASDLDDRLAMLDAIVAYLPAGARAWLKAGSWSEVAGNRLMLAFAERPRDSDVVIDLRSPSAARRVDVLAASYRDRLVELCDRRGADAVIKHLAAYPEVRARDAVDAEGCLFDLDLSRSVLQAARTGSLTPTLVRRLDKRDGFTGLNLNERTEVLRGYLWTATPADLDTDRDLLVRRWESTVEPAFADVLRARITGKAWRTDTLLVAAAIAEATGAYAAFLSGLTPAGNVVSPAVTTTLIQLSTSENWRYRVVPLVAESAPLAQAVARAQATTDDDAVRALAEWLDTEDDTKAWARVSRVYRAAASGNGQIDTDDLDYLYRSDPDSVPLLVRLADDRRSPTKSKLVHAVLGWAARLAPDGMVALLNGLPDVEPQHLAGIDFALYRAGQRPRTSLTSAGPEYHAELVSLVTQANLSRTQREQFIVAVADHGMGRGWSTDPQRLQLVLDTLRRLASPGGPQPTIAVPPPLITRMVQEIEPRHQFLLHRPELQPWLRVLARSPELRCPANRQRLRNLPDDASPDRVATLFTALARDNCSVDMLLDDVRESAWRPGAAGWLEMMTALTVKLHNDGIPAAEAMSVQIADRLVRGLFGDGTAVDAIQQLSEGSPPLLRLGIQLTWLAATVGGPRGYITSQPELNAVQQQLTALIRETDKSAGKAGRWGRTRRDGEPR